MRKRIEVLGWYGYEWDFLYNYNFATDIELQSLKSILKSNPELIAKLKTEMEVRLEEINSFHNLPEEGKQAFYNQFLAQEEHTIENITKWNNYSLCLSFFAFFESRLKELCYKIQNEFQFKIQLNDLRRDEDIKRYCTYFTKVFEVDLRDIKPHLDFIAQQKLIRNTIAHNDGAVLPADLKRIQKCPGLDIDNFNNIHLSDQYLLCLFEHADKFFSRLAKLIDIRYVEIKKIAKFKTSQD